MNSLISFFTPLLIIIITLSCATYARNIVWHDDITLWKDVVKKTPNNSRAHLELGNAYGRQEMIDEAIEEFKSAIRLKPFHAWAYNNLGIAYAKKGMLDEALSAFLKSVTLQSAAHAETYLNIGVIYFKKGMIHEAIKYFKISISLDEYSATAHNNLAVAYKSIGWNERAEEHFSIAHQLDPDKY